MSEHRYSEPNRIEHQDRQLPLVEDLPAFATKRSTADEQRASGTRTQPNGPAANGGDQ